MLTWAELTAAHSSEVSIKIIQKTMASADPKLCLTTRRYEMIEKYFTVDILQCWELVNAKFLKCWHRGNTYSLDENICPSEGSVK